MASGSTLLWGAGMDDVMVVFNESLSFDKAFYKVDIQGSIAYAKALFHRNLISSSELSDIITGLQRVESEWESGSFKILLSVDEDIHTANERRLAELIGSAIAGKLHTGRSRNEQIATDIRLWLRGQLVSMRATVVDILRVVTDSAEREIGVLMPGYTHMQRAQPIRFSQWLLSHGSYLLADLQRLDGVVERVNSCPLGVGALAGNPFDIDRDFLAKELGFATIHPNSIAAVADRDFVVETLQWGSLVMIHLSRLSEDLIIYSTAEFGFIRIADAYSTGSSLMPQKKNPDSLELIRGKAGRVLGQMTGFMSTLKSLPSAYNKDLQESVEPLLDCVHTVSLSLKIILGVLSTLSINRKNMQSALTVDMLATEVADYLVKRGVPFRQTHHIAGAVIKKAEESGVSIDELSLEELKPICPEFGEDYSKIFDFESSVERRSSNGGTSKSSVLAQIEAIRTVLPDLEKGAESH